MNRWSRPFIVGGCCLFLTAFAFISIRVLRVEALHPDGSSLAAPEQAASLPFLDSGILVEVPEGAAGRIGLDYSEPVRPLSPITQQRIETTMTSVLHCWDRYVDNVFIIRHPEPTRRSSTDLRDHFMAATVTVDAHDPVTGLPREEPALNLYLYLPDDLLDGSGIDTPLTNTTIVPYAAAPVPQTLGEFLDWTLYHESWHLLELHARLKQFATDPRRRELEVVFADPVQWQNAYPELAVGHQLGWRDTGERYLWSDELQGERIIRAGATSYQFELGSIAVDYDDGDYTFRRQLLRIGYLPDELHNLADLESLLRSGKIPTLYALFNTFDERSAEYGAWFLFARSTGHGRAFQELFPELHRAYELRMQAARHGCLPKRQKVNNPVRALFESATGSAYIK